MSDEQRREYDEILSGVEIDDHTFHVIEDHENGTKGTIAILDEISQKLLAFRKTIQDFEFIMDIEDKRHHLYEVQRDIYNGDYFSSIDDVWETKHESFDNINVKLFDGAYNDTLNEAGQGYQNTAIGAIDSNSDVEDDDSSADGSSESSSNTSNSNVVPLDIFGSKMHVSQPAYLMPQSSQCASLWYHFVPWVLCPWEDIKSTTCNDEIAASRDVNTERQEEAHTYPTTSDDHPTDLEDETRWNFLQKCIHGFKLDPAAVNKSSLAIEGNINDKADNESQATETGKQNRETSNTGTVGIPYFLTNQIRIKDREFQLSMRHCLFIVPILTVEQVKKWNGSSYDAIVLAGKGMHAEQIVAMVYRRIGATEGTIDFGNGNECDMACTLLRSMILCTCQSSKSTFTETFLTTNEAAKKWYAPRGGKYAVYIKPDQTTIPVPVCRDWNRQYRVRKITFSASHEVYNNPAPDPVLLVGRAASNWLKCQRLNLLPSRNIGCAGSNSSGSNSVASFREEMTKRRGWTSNILEQLHMNDGSAVDVRYHSDNDDDVNDEPLSDDEE